MQATVHHFTTPHLDLLHGKVHHPAVAPKSKSISVYYDADVIGIDLADEIDKLIQTPGSPYFLRTRSVAAGMMLAERLREELAVDNQQAKGA